MLKGIDISMHQGNLSLFNVKDKIDFVLMKATEGSGYVDPKFRFFQDEARRLGLLRGYYHFARPDLPTTPESEANHFCNTLEDILPGELLVLDYEPDWKGRPALDGDEQVQWCLDFLKTVESRLGFKPLIYLNGYQNSIMDWKPVVDNDNGLWLATYLLHVDFTNPPKTDWPFIAMWQYSSTGRVEGASGNLDMNVFYGDKEQFLKYGYKGEGVKLPTTKPVEAVVTPLPPREDTSTDTYTVKTTDFDGLAAAMGRIGISNWQEVAKLNGLRPPYVIHPGNVLKLPGTTRPTESVNYKIITGDTLGQISFRFGNSIDQIMKWNPIIKDPNEIQAGWVIRVK